jgi:uncharacterized protein (TIGR03083 family)
MEVADYITSVAQEGERFAAAAEAGPLSVAIPDCPDWDMRDLVRHLGLIHLWAAGNVAYTTDDWLDADTIAGLGRYWPELAGEWPEDANLVSWYRETNKNLVRVLSDTPADHNCFSFLPAPTPLTMWARRQASEIAIHRYDAEIARGITGSFDTGFAADMLDEVLSGFASRPGRTLDIAADKIIDVHADDTDEHWYLTLTPESTQSSPTGGDSDLSVSGSASDLYLLFWNRRPDSTVSMSGETELMDTWRSNFRVRWSGEE